MQTFHAQAHVFIVTSNTSDQAIDAQIRYVDMQEEAKDRVEMDRSWGITNEAPIFEFRVFDQACVLLDPVLAYALVNNSKNHEKKSELLFGVTTAEQALERWIDTSEVN
jgi:hypothetical protein